MEVLDIMEAMVDKGDQQVFGDLSSLQAEGLR